MVGLSVNRVLAQTLGQGSMVHILNFLIFDYSRLESHVSSFRHSNDYHLRSIIAHNDSAAVLHPLDSPEGLAAPSEACEEFWRERYHGPGPVLDGQCVHALSGDKVMAPFAEDGTPS